MSQITFLKVMTDEHVLNAVADQLKVNDVDVVRLIDVLEVGTPDPDVIEYCHTNEIALITFDAHILRHVGERLAQGKYHAGIFIGTNMQGMSGVGKMVEFVTFFDQAIKSGAATVGADVYNEITYVK